MRFYSFSYRLFSWGSKIISVWLNDSLFRIVACALTMDKKMLCFLVFPSSFLFILFCFLSLYFYFIACRCSCFSQFLQFSFLFAVILYGMCEIIIPHIPAFLLSLHVWLFLWRVMLLFPFILFHITFFYVFRFIFICCCCCLRYPLYDQFGVTL